MYSSVIYFFAKYLCVHWFVLEGDLFKTRFLELKNHLLKQTANRRKFQGAMSYAYFCMMSLADYKI